jgi:hypothetical protein
VDVEQLAFVEELAYVATLHRHENTEVVRNRPTPVAGHIHS